MHCISYFHWSRLHEWKRGSHGWDPVSSKPTFESRCNKKRSSAALALWCAVIIKMSFESSESKIWEHWYAHGRLFSRRKKQKTCRHIFEMTVAWRDQLIAMKGNVRSLCQRIILFLSNQNKIPNSCFLLITNSVLYWNQDTIESKPPYQGLPSADLSFCIHYKSVK